MEKNKRSTGNERARERVHERRKRRRKKRRSFKEQKDEGRKTARNELSAENVNESMLLEQQREKNCDRSVFNFLRHFYKGSELF